MRCANTGWREEANARPIKLNSRTFLFRNVVFRILTRRNMPQKAQKAQKAQKISSMLFVPLVPLVPFVLFCGLALDDLHIRIELDVEVALTNILVLFQACQTHRCRVVVLLNDLGLHRHAA